MHEIVLQAGLYALALVLTLVQGILPEPASLLAGTARLGVSHTIAGLNLPAPVDMDESCTVDNSLFRCPFAGESVGQVDLVFTESYEPYVTPLATPHNVTTRQISLRGHALASYGLYNSLERRATSHMDSLGRHLGLRALRVVIFDRTPFATSDPFTWIYLVQVCLGAIYMSVCVCITLRSSGRAEIADDEFIHVASTVKSCVLAVLCAMDSLRHACAALGYEIHTYSNLVSFAVACSKVQVVLALSSQRQYYLQFKSDGMPPEDVNLSKPISAQESHHQSSSAWDSQLKSNHGRTALPMEDAQEDYEDSDEYFRDLMARMATQAEEDGSSSTPRNGAQTIGYGTSSSGDAAQTPSGKSSAGTNGSRNVTPTSNTSLSDARSLDLQPSAPSTTASCSAPLHETATLPSSRTGTGPSTGASAPSAKIEEPANTPTPSTYVDGQGGVYESIHAPKNRALRAQAETARRPGGGPVHLPAPNVRFPSKGGVYDSIWAPRGPAGGSR